MPRDVTLGIQLTAPSYMAYTTGKLVRIVEIDTGAQVAVIDFEPGDPQEGAETLHIPLTGLQPNTTYMVTADYRFTKINAAPWSVGGIGDWSWTFTTGND